MNTQARDTFQAQLKERIEREQRRQKQAEESFDKVIAQVVEEEKKRERTG